MEDENKKLLRNISASQESIIGLERDLLSAQSAMHSSGYVGARGASSSANPALTIDGHAMGAAGGYKAGKHVKSDIGTIFATASTGAVLNEINDANADSSASKDTVAGAQEKLLQVTNQCQLIIVVMCC
jgi:hypothetical protein